MPKVAQLDDKKIVFVVSDLLDVPEGENFVAVQDESVLGLQYKNREFVTPDIPNYRLYLLEQIRLKRKEMESNGTPFMGGRLQTDDASQSKVANAVDLIERIEVLQPDAPPIEIDFEIQPNTWIKLGKNELIIAGVTIGRHVQECFSYSKNLFDIVSNPDLTDEQLKTIDVNVGWPGA